MSSGLILVTGADGVIGSDLVRQLLSRGWRVKAMTRRAGGAPRQQDSRLQVVHADMRDHASLLAAVRGVSAVVHLAAAKADERESEDVNVGGAQRLVAACHAAPCRRVINLSTQSAKIVRRGVYAHTKAKADEVFRRSGLDVTILLPSIVYSEAKGGVFGAILTFIQRLPVVPVLGNGKWISAPVHVSDVSAAIISCLENDATIGRQYDIGGPELLAFDELIDRIGLSIGARRPKLHIPLEISLLCARLLALLPRPPITVSNVLGSNQDTHIDIGPARRDFGFNPLPLSTGLQRSLSPTVHVEVSGSSAADSTSDDVATDCRLISRYLIDRSPPADVVSRYRDARARLAADGQLSLDGEWRWVRQHPWALPFVDASAAVLCPEDSSTRKQIFLVAALLEASPVNADLFLEQPTGPLRAFVTLCWHGSRAVLNAVVGMPLLVWSRRRQ
jgi:nucleoside-diphosphate-sugar epimerase